ncbi:MAG: phosphopantetheine-binding protein, partial [Bacteroidota bacterium]
LEKCISLKLPVQVIWRSDLNEAYRQNRELVKHLLTEKILEAEQASDVRNRLDRSAISANFKQAGSDTEEKLVAIYEQFFGLEGIGVEDSFFEIGGDSLKAMVLLQRIKKSFATELSLHDFFVARHISNIAQLLDEKIWLNQKSTKKYESII